MNLKPRRKPGDSHEPGSSWSPARKQQCEGSRADMEVTQKCA
jgi:hypothetical protein